MKTYFHLPKFEENLVKAREWQRFEKSTWTQTVFNRCLHPLFQRPHPFFCLFSLFPLTRKDEMNVVFLAFLFIKAPLQTSYSNLGKLQLRFVCKDAHNKITLTGIPQIRTTNAIDSMQHVVHICLYVHTCLFMQYYFLTAVVTRSFCR